VQPLARVRLLAALVAAALQAPASSNERAAVVCRIVADGLPAAAIALQVAAGVLPQFASTDQGAWTQAPEACPALIPPPPPATAIPWPRPRPSATSPKPTSTNPQPLPNPHSESQVTST